MNKTTTGAPGSSGRAFVVLDGLRGIAAPLVIMFHAEPLLGRSFTPMSGYLAVDLFFVLSGFVIAHAYDDRFASGYSPAKFMLRRLIRFYPLYLVSLVIGLLTIIVAVNLKVLVVPWMSWITMAPEILFLPGYKSQVPGWLPQSNLFLFALNIGAYTLFAELVINLIYAVFWKRLTLKVLATFTVICAGFIVWSITSRGHLFGGTFGDVYVLLPRVMFSFFLGALMFRFYSKGIRAPRVPAWLCFIATAVMLFPNILAGFRPAYDCGAILLAGPLLVWFGATAHAGARINGFAHLAGQLSYAAYILHPPLQTIIFQADAKLFHDRIARLAPLGGVGFVVGILVLAWLADVYFDVPVRKMLTEQLVRRQKRA